MENVLVDERCMHIAQFMKETVAVRTLAHLVVFFLFFLER